MSSLVRAVRIPSLRMMCRMYSTGIEHNIGSGAGMGGGAGGTIRESGGAFGIREAVMEEQYFRRLGAQQLEELHEHYHEEIKFLEKQLKEMEEKLMSHKKKLRTLKEITHELS